LDVAQNSKLRSDEHLTTFPVDENSTYVENINMARKPNSSRQTRALLAALLDAASEWHYGYDLSKATDLKSGTLYPILMRLEAHGWLEARWEESPVAGKPPRHLYRLTATGVQEAPAMLRSHQETAGADGLKPAHEGASS
jgi:PadR family transcriptional regulator PadR